MKTKIEKEATEAVNATRKAMATANEIDWEQRRYEIAKECTPTIYSLAVDVARRKGEIMKPQYIASVAVDIADVLIEELKKKK